MLKTLKIIRAIVLLPVSLPLIFGLGATMWLANRIARTDRKRAAWLLLRLATFMRRMPNSKPQSERGIGVVFVAPALLLQGAPWKRVRKWSETSVAMLSTSFKFYFAEQRFDQALEAAEDWCRATEAKIADCPDEMREFFEQHGDDLSQPARIELWIQHSKAQEAAWEANPQSKPPSLTRFLKPKPPRFPRFLEYYDAHLALDATRWIATRDLTSDSVTREFARQAKESNYFGLPQFRVSDASLQSLGMNPTELAAIRQKAMGR